MPVYLTAVIEEILKAVIEESTDGCQTNKVKTIGVQHIQEALRSSTDLSIFFNNVDIFNTTLPVNISAAQVPHKKRRSRKA